MFRLDYWVPRSSSNPGRPGFLGTWTAIVAMSIGLVVVASIVLFAWLVVVVRLLLHR